MFGLGIVFVIVLLVVMFEKKRYRVISLKDERLVWINPAEPHFFDNVLSFQTEDFWIKRFIQTTTEIKEANVDPFYTPFLLNVSTNKKEKAIFIEGVCKGAHSFKWWKNIIQKMPSVEGRFWRIGTQEQYHVFLVYLINKLIKEKHMNINDAFMVIFRNGEKLGEFSKCLKFLDMKGEICLIAGGIESEECNPFFDGNYYNTNTKVCYYNCSPWLVL